MRNALASGLFLARRTGRIALLAGMALMTCAATVLAEQGGPLFMVAGVPNEVVGATIGFIGNVTVSGQAAESALRGALVYTIAWIPVAAILAVAAIDKGVSAMTARISRARGIPSGATALSRALPEAGALSLAYALSCFASFIFRLPACNTSFVEAPWALACAVIATNCLLLSAIYLISSCIASLTRAPLLSAFLTLTFHIGALLAYPNAYIAGSAPAIVWANPAVCLMHTCSLNTQSMLLGAIAIIGALAIGICCALMYFACNHQEACQ
ncbi:MAG: hypothetical protein Q4B77_07125 [Coriobacteriaceae bacterium]|nr:hypothetical protein [Coriobacteriaceae bacterium]